MRYFPTSTLPVATSLRAAAALTGATLPPDAAPAADPFAPRALVSTAVLAAAPAPVSALSACSVDGDGAATDGDTRAGLKFLSCRLKRAGAGHVDGLAWELVGPEVAVKAVWAAMVGSLNRDEQTSKITFRGERFALEG